MRGSTIIVLASLPVLALLTGTRLPAQQPTPAVWRASDFVNSVGVNSHFGYWDTPYNSAWPAISSALEASGIRHIRDGYVTKKAPYLARLSSLAAHGIKDAVVFGRDATPDQVRATLGLLGPATIDSVEPENEPDDANNPQWESSAASEQATLYRTIHGDDRFAGITVLGPALAEPSRFTRLGPLDQFEDAGNLHQYTCDVNPGTDLLHFGIATNLRWIRESTVTKPIWTTEIGYSDDLSLMPKCGLPDDAIAKYVPRTVAERWLSGQPRLYFYQLADMPSDHRFGKFGLLNADGSPKPQFTALADMLHVLSDGSNAPFTPVPPALAIDVPGTRFHSLVLEKHDRTYDVLLWHEVQSVDWVTRLPKNVEPGSAQVTFPPAVKVARIFTYQNDYRLHDVPLVVRSAPAPIPVTDSITIVEFKE